jgi:small GTP-binding protein
LVGATVPEARFTFCLDGSAYCCPSVIAEFLSPRVSSLRLTDSTISEFFIGTPHAGDHFARVLALGFGGCLELSSDLKAKREELLSIRSISKDLANSELLEMCDSALFQLAFDARESMDPLKFLSALGFCSEIDAAAESAVRILASGFCELSEAELDSLSLSTFARAVSDPCLVLADEDSLFRAISRRAMADRSCLSLLEFVRFEFVSALCIESVIELLGNSLEFLTLSIWQSLLPRLVLPFHEAAPATEKRAEITDLLPLGKCRLVGESGVGKKSILARLTCDTFRSVSQPTIGVDFGSFVHSDIRLQIWDTAGDERFRRIVRTYFLGTDAVAFVFSLENRASFEMIETWRADVEGSHSPSPVMILVGNQVDRESDRQVPETEAREYAAQHNMSYIETSARTGAGIHELFEATAHKVHAAKVRSELTRQC